MPFSGEASRSKLWKGSELELQHMSAEIKKPARGGVHRMMIVKRCILVKGFLQAAVLHSPHAQDPAGSVNRTYSSTLWLFMKTHTFSALVRYNIINVASTTGACFEVASITLPSSIVTSPFHSGAIGKSHFLYPPFVITLLGHSGSQAPPS